MNCRTVACSASGDCLRTSMGRAGRRFTSYLNHPRPSSGGPCRSRGVAMLISQPRAKVRPLPTSKSTVNATFTSLQAGKTEEVPARSGMAALVPLASVSDRARTRVRVAINR